MANDGDAPGATQDFLSLHPAHVVHVCVVFGETKDPKQGNHMDKRIYNVNITYNIVS